MVFNEANKIIYLKATVSITLIGTTVFIGKIIICSTTIVPAYSTIHVYKNQLDLSVGQVYILECCQNVIVVTRVAEEPVVGQIGIYLPTERF